MKGVTKKTSDGSISKEKKYSSGLYSKKNIKRRLKNIAEAIILQAMEDLWSPVIREESIEFFKGEGFKICARIAGMNEVKRHRVLHLLAASAPKRTKPLSPRKRKGRHSF